MKSRKAGCPAFGYEDLATLRDSSFFYSLNIDRITPPPSHDFSVSLGWIRIDIDDSILPIDIYEHPIVGFGRWLVIDKKLLFLQYPVKDGARIISRQIFVLVVVLGKSTPLDEYIAPICLDACICPLGKRI